MDFLDNVKFINRLAYLIGGLAVFILIFCFIGYGISHWFLIDTVIINGDMEHTDTHALSYIAREKVEGNLFTLDINDIQDDFRQIPWVKRVTVSREFPNSITVGVSEYTAVARLGDEGLISDDGKVFNGTDDTGNLPVFDAPEQNISEALTDYKLINHILGARQVKVTKLYINGLGISKIDLSNNLRVVICGTAIETQIKLLDQYWDKLYDLNPDLNYVNMCYKNALAINAINKPAAAAANIIRKPVASAVLGRR